MMVHHLQALTLLQKVRPTPEDFPREGYAHVWGYSVLHFDLKSWPGLAFLLFQNLGEMMPSTSVP